MVKLQIPQYRFHYFIQDNKDGDNKPQGVYKIGENVYNSFGAGHSRRDMKVVSYRTEKSDGLQSNGNYENLPYRFSLNSPQQNYTTKELTASSEAPPIVVEPLNTPDQQSSKSDKGDSRNEFQRTESVTNVPHFTEQVNTNQTKDRNDNIKDEPATDQIQIQDDDMAVKKIEFTVPFKKPNPVNTDDFKYVNDETIKQNIVNKVIQNINEDHDQYKSQLSFESPLSDKLLKVVNVDSIETERQNYQPSHDGHSNFKSQHLSNKPLRLLGYNPSAVHSLYDMEAHYNLPSQIQQPPSSFIQGYAAGLEAHSDNIRPQSQTQDNSGMYFSQPTSTIHVGNYKGNQKYNEPLYYYDPATMSMLPIPVYTNMIQNSYSQAENKPNPTLPADPNKNGFNLMEILSGGSFYKGTEQAEVPQQTAVKGSIVKHESHKLEKVKPSEKVKPLDTTNNKIKPLQTLVYVNPDDTSIQLTYGQQPQADCKGQTHKAPALRVDKPLQPIPLCTNCKPALALMGLPSTKLARIQQKKSVASPQIVPLWDGQHVSKFNYLILPNPMTK